VNDLKSFEPGKPAQLVAHHNDNFGAAVPKQKPEIILASSKRKIILFFGLSGNARDWICYWKPSSKLQTSNIKLIAGEFYENNYTRNK
jgi:hypothetical protein